MTPLGSFDPRRPVGRILFISHDLGLIHHVSDRILVMKDGRAVEHGTADDIFERPQHPSTQKLLTAVPRLRSAGARCDGPSPSWIGRRVVAFGTP